MGKNEISVLIEDFADQDPMVRENAAYLLGEKAAEANAISQNTLKNADQIEQQCVISKQANWNAAISGLLACLSDEEPWVRGNAADALGKFADAMAVPQLEVALRDNDRIVRLSAAESLGQIADPRAIEGLNLATKDSEWSVRLSAIRALSNFSNDSVREIFVSAKTDPNQDVRLACVKAIGSQDQRDVTQQ